MRLRANTLAAMAAVCVACGASPSARPAQQQPVSKPTYVATVDPTRLPEDPVAGKLSELQWREHMQHEEDERQMLFDGQRIKQHRALIKLMSAARERYDRATSEALVARVRAEMPRRLTEMQRRITELDHWGVNSRLLPDYAALQALLQADYADAKLAALHGDSHALDQVREAFDQRLKKMSAWLEQAAEGQHEHEEHDEGKER